MAFIGENVIDFSGGSREGVHSRFDYQLRKDRTRETAEIEPRSTPYFKIKLRLRLKGRKNFFFETGLAFCPFISGSG